jgi:hypothetical protein
LFNSSSGVENALSGSLCTWLMLPTLAFEHFDTDSITNFIFIKQNSKKLRNVPESKQKPPKTLQSSSNHCTVLLRTFQLKNLSNSPDVKIKKMSNKYVQDDKKSEIVLTSNLSVDLLRLLESAQHFDVVFIVGGERIQGDGKIALLFFFRGDF